MVSKIVVLVVLYSISFHVAAANNLFNQPQRLCSALVSDGLRTQGWKSNIVAPGEWSCTTTLVPFGTAGSNGMENNIAFHAYGTSPNQANSIRLKININNDKERTQAFSRFNSTIKSLFKALAQPIPQELLDAISQQKPVLISTSFVKIELMLKPNPQIDSIKAVLTITPSSLLRKKQTTYNSQKIQLIHDSNNEL